MSCFEKCKEVVAGGESSYARLIGTRPIVMDHGEGPCFYDVDGNRYIDWCIGYGPMIFGHRPKAIVDAVVKQITERGMLYTFPHELDYEVGRKIAQAVPGIEQVRFANSGSEATQAAIRLARGYTGKEKILKWEGSYNGFLDCHAYSHVPALEAAGPEKFPRTLPSLAGIPRVFEDTVVVALLQRPRQRRDAHQAPRPRARRGAQPSPSSPTPASSRRSPASSRGCGASATRTACSSSSTRSSPAFACRSAAPRSCYGVTPDITCVAKAVGGGTPGAAAFGASKEIMQIEADNVVLHGGTYSANPLTLAGMNAALDILIDDRERVYGHLNAIADGMVDGMNGIFAEQGVAAWINRVGPMWQVFFGHEGPVTRYRQARASDTRFFGILQAECQARGVYFHNFNFERFFACLAHTQAEVDESLNVIETATKIVKERLSALPVGV